MPTAEIITIGTEILLGEIVDTNSRYIARVLRDIGVDLYRTTTVGDNTGRIALAIQQAAERSEIIITTGGLGPTVDDPTREAVAQAAGVQTEFRPELWEQIQARFQRYGRAPTENNKRQAYVPQGAIAIENPVGTAPAFIVLFTVQNQERVIFSLPGVPREMEHLLQYSVVPFLRQRYDLHGIIKARVLHTSGIGESMIDERVGDLEQLSNPTVGLAAHSGQVDVRITAKAESEAEADAMIMGIETDLRRRLGKWIYGADQDTLEQSAIQALKVQGWTLVVLEAGVGGDLIKQLSAAGQSFRGGEVLTNLPGPQELLEAIAAFRQTQAADVGLGVALHQGPEKADVYLALITPGGEKQLTRSYGGPPGYASLWAVNHSLDIIRHISM